MSDKPTEKSAPAEVEVNMPLDEFCAEVSLKDRRVELISVFRHVELAAGRHHDTRSKYAARYAQIEARPVK